MALFTMDGFYHIFRWLHLFFGIIWIGHLYYFNFTQGVFFGKTDANTKTTAIRQLLPEALWWFRWGAMWTWVTGMIMLGLKGHIAGHAIYASGWGVWILLGAAMATLMWANVWFIIWPNQQIVIANAEATTAGKPADPNAAAAGARALLASRHNVLFSIGMLFFMLSASHLPPNVDVGSPLGLLAGVLTVVLGAIEFNAIKGKLGPLTTVKGVIASGFALCAVLVAIVEIIL